MQNPCFSDGTAHNLELLEFLGCCEKPAVSSTCHVKDFSVNSDSVGHISIIYRSSIFFFQFPMAAGEGGQLQPRQKFCCLCSPCLSLSHCCCM